MAGFYAFLADSHGLFHDFPKDSQQKMPLLARTLCQGFGEAKWEPKATPKGCRSVLLSSKDGSAWQAPNL